MTDKQKGLLREMRNRHLAVIASMDAGCKLIGPDGEDLTPNIRAKHQEAADAIEAALKEVEALRVLAQGIMPDSWDEWSPIDPDEMQGLLHSAGLLRKQHMDGPCGDACFCAAETGFPIECNRYTDTLLGILDRSPETPNEPAT